MKNPNTCFSYLLEDAIKYGTDAATILFKLSSNNFTMKDLRVAFPQFTESQIKNCLKKLETAGAIKVSRFNQKDFDQTKWYAVLDEHSEIPGECHEQIESRTEVRSQR